MAHSKKTQGLLHWMQQPPENGVFYTFFFHTEGDSAIRIG